jgi:cytochrome c oxidase subunit II
MRVPNFTRGASAIAAAVVATACDGPQSALVAAGRDSARILQLTTVMTIGSLIVWAAVVVVAVYAIRSGRSHTERAANLFVVGGGVALPTVVLAALLAYGLPALPRVLALPPDGSLMIHVTGKQWWWRVEYVTPSGIVETANELRLPVGQRVHLQLTSPDVIHSFWVPSIAGKMDMIPGRDTHLALEPTRTGVFQGQCAEYCGASHARMAFDVVVVDAPDFDGWLAAQRTDAVAPSVPLATDGQRAFLANGCTACHTIRGTPAGGRIGPDLTHVGGRRRLAAGSLPNDREAFVRWMGETHAVKPGAHMPAFRALGGETLVALATYLDGLQ